MIRKYSFNTHGEEYISEHFQVKEFRCKDGSDLILISDELIDTLEAIRAYYELPIKVVSGYRTVEHNRKVGGAKNSQHTKGTAADIQIEGVVPHQIYNDIDNGEHIGGLGRYKSFTHIDVRGYKVRWRVS